MKRQFYTLALLLVAAIAVAQPTQWVITTPSVPALPSRSVTNYVHAPDPLTCWAVLRDTAGSTSTTGLNKVMLTVDGAASWATKTMPVTGAASVANLVPASVWGVSATKAFIPMFSATGGNGKLMRTINGGTAWTSAIAGSFVGTQGGFPDFTVFFNANEGVTVGDPTSSYFEIWRTTDGGTTWTRVPSANIAAPLNPEEYGLTDAFAVNGDHAWFGTTLGRMYHTSDKGLTWTAASTPYQNGATLATSFGISTMAFESATTGFAATNGTNASPSTPHRFPELIKTTDGGATWTIVPTPGADTIKTHSSIAYVPNTANTYFMSGSDDTGANARSAYSVNGGASWIGASEANGNNSIGDIWFADATTGYSAVNYLGALAAIWNGPFFVPSCVDVTGATRVSKDMICSGDTMSVWTTIDTTGSPQKLMNLFISFRNDAGVWSPVRTIDVNNTYTPTFTSAAGTPNVGIFKIDGFSLSNLVGAPQTENAHYKLQFAPTYCGTDTSTAAYTDVKLAIASTTTPAYTGCALAVVSGNTINLDLTACQSTPAVINYTVSYSVNGAPAVAGSSFTTGTPGTYAVDFLIDNGVCEKTVSGSLTIVGTDNAKEQANGLVVFPNPATDRLVLTNLNAATKNVQIVDVNGKVVLSLMPTNGVIAINELPNGVYFAQSVDTNNISLQRIRFVKQ